MEKIIIKDNNKWLALIGTVICMFALGTIYAWSLFNHPIAEKFNWRIEDVAFTFAITGISLSVASLFSSKLRCLFGLQKVVAMCGLVLGLGLMLASKISSLTGLYLTAGFLVGAADGVAYLMVLSNSIKWFPNNRGLVSGVAVSAFGLGSFVFKYIIIYIFNHGGVSAAFFYWGLAVIVCMLIGSFFLRTAPGIAECEGKIKLTINPNAKDFNWHEMIKVREFWLLLFVFFCCCMSGLFLIGVANDLAIEWVGLSIAKAATAVTLIAIANTTGRLILGQLSDKMPRLHIVSLICALLFLASVLIVLAQTNIIIFFVCIIVIAFCFGGTVAVFPALVGDMFGLKHMTKNYSILYQGFGLGAVVGMFVSVWLGGFLNTFILLIVLSFFSLLITIFIKKPVKRQAKKNSK